MIFHNKKKLYILIGKNDTVVVTFWENNGGYSGFHEIILISLIEQGGGAEDVGKEWIIDHSSLARPRILYKGWIIMQYFENEGRFVGVFDFPTLKFE